MITYTNSYVNIRTYFLLEKVNCRRIGNSLLILQLFAANTLLGKSEEFSEEVQDSVDKVL